MKKLQLNRPPLLVDLIIEKLEQAFIDGDIPPGTRLTEEMLSRDLNTSRTPVREALFKLEQMGFVVRRETGGWDVRSMDIDKFIERYDVKAMVEVYSILRSTPATRRAFIETVEPIRLKMSEAVDNLDYESYRKWDRQLHTSLLSMYENNTSVKMYEESLKYLLWVRKMAISPYLDIKESFRNHSRMIKNIEDGNVLAAADELVKHHARLISKVKKDLADTNPQRSPDN
jgi:DNA-binding GntR family transcriptional regulator